MEVAQSSSLYLLVIVPCGRSKIWDTEPERGPVLAAKAYSGTPFKLNRAYAERFGDAWVVLSAKYGFISPEFVISEPYEVTFNRKRTNPISHDRLQQQVADMQLDRFTVVIGLGGKAYRDAIAAAFEGLNVQLVFPFAGLPLGRMLQATKQAIDSGDPGSNLARKEP